MQKGRVRVFIASSLDGFIAGPDDDLSWLSLADKVTEPSSSQTPTALQFEDFISDIGIIIMGRRTYETVRGFDGLWPYDDLPVWVLTHRNLDPGHPSSVSAASVSVTHVIDRAFDILASQAISDPQSSNGHRDIYLDGGHPFGNPSIRDASTS